LKKLSGAVKVTKEGKFIIERKKREGKNGNKER
jgi:hypothetical protein